ncbi:MAG: hypothetical protein COA94_02655, partial [Rickettsiales bacterium]
MKHIHIQDCSVPSLFQEAPPADKQLTDAELAGAVVAARGRGVLFSMACQQNETPEHDFLKEVNVLIRAEYKAAVKWCMSHGTCGVSGETLDWVAELATIFITGNNTRHVAKSFHPYREIYNPGEEAQIFALFSEMENSPPGELISKFLKIFDVANAAQIVEAVIDSIAADEDLASIIRAGLSNAGDDEITHGLVEEIIIKILIYSQSDSTIRGANAYLLQQVIEKHPTCADGIREVYMAQEAMHSAAANMVPYLQEPLLDNKQLADAVVAARGKGVFFTRAYQDIPPIELGSWTEVNALIRAEYEAS